MFNCEHCWNSPCTCGHEYKGWSIEQLKSQIEMLQKVLKETEAKCCKIVGSEEWAGFYYICSPKRIKAVCKRIWDNPEKYAKRKLGDDYYDFLKFLWVKYPDGKEVLLAEVVDTS